MSRFRKDEELWLLHLARRAIAARLAGEPLDAGRREASQRKASQDEAEVPSELLRQPSGAFVTLEKAGALRGCVGFIEPELPLFRTVMEAALSAAFRDPRFPPVGEEELESLAVKVSVLSSVAPILPEDVVVGRHGLVISQAGCRGLLLPGVPVEQGWDRERFLEETCLKAGLAPSAWRSGASVCAFTAEAFSDSPRQPA